MTGDQLRNWAFLLTEGMTVEVEFDGEWHELDLNRIRAVLKPTLPIRLPRCVAIPSLHQGEE